VNQDLKDCVLEARSRGYLSALQFPDAVGRLDGGPEAGSDRFFHGSYKDPATFVEFIESLTLTMVVIDGSAFWCSHSSEAGEPLGGIRSFTVAVKQEMYSFRKFGLKTIPPGVVAGSEELSVSSVNYKFGESGSDQTCKVYPAPPQLTRHLVEEFSCLSIDRPVIPTAFSRASPHPPKP
jgi:hypothetical protein